MKDIKRRQVIGSLSLATSHILFPTILSGFISGCGRDDHEGIFFSEQEMKLIREIIDLIVPVTKTASASQVDTHYFLDEVFARCLEIELQELIKEGLQSFKHSFQSSDNPFELLSDVDAKAYAGDDEYSWFIPIKQYTLIGFFTSQVGTTKASNYVPVPGEYRGEILLDEQTQNYGLTALRYYL